jgi:hypothetical protein
LRLRLTAGGVSGRAREPRIVEDVIFPTKVVQSGSILDDHIALLGVVLVRIVVIEIGGEQEHHEHGDVESDLRERERQIERQVNKRD